MQKIVSVTTSLTPQTSITAMNTHGLLSSRLGTAENTMHMIEPKYYSTRSEIAALEGVTVLPGMHDPTPIGATLAALLVHIKALPTETMREVSLRLAEVHGPAFHPDT